MVDDSRLVLRVLHESIAAGGSALNYVKVDSLLIEQDTVVGARIKAEELHETIELRAPVVISATGAWADRLRNQLNPEMRVRPLRGSHIIIPRQHCPVTDVLTALHPDDKRGVYIYPWEGTTVLGTTDLDHTEDLDTEACITEGETQYLLKAFNTLFPNNPLQQSDVISTWAGVRPVIASENSKDPSKERRNHAVWSDEGLITVSGGKLTTFRLIALDALAVAQPLLPEAQPFTHDRVFATPTTDAKTLVPNNPAWGQRLLGRYGDMAGTMLAAGSNQEHSLIGDTEFCLAECRWAARHESVRHLDDLLLRRTRLGMCLANGGEAIFPEIKAICCTELGWTDTLWDAELARYKTIWKQFYFFGINP